MSDGDLAIAVVGALAVLAYVLDLDPFALIPSIGAPVDQPIAAVRTPIQITRDVSLPVVTTPQTPTNGDGYQTCAIYGGQQLVECVRSYVGNSDPFEITKRVAWLLRGTGAGLLRKESGENVVNWKGINFSGSRLCYDNGQLIKIVSDAGPGGVNGAEWVDDGPLPDDSNRFGYVAPIDPDS